MSAEGFLLSTFHIWYIVNLNKQLVDIEHFSPSLFIAKKTWQNAVFQRFIAPTL